MGFWFSDRLRFNFKAFARRDLYMTEERAVMLVKKSDLFREIQLSERFLYQNEVLMLRF